jgi:hypothetical protein
MKDAPTVASPRNNKDLRQVPGLVCTPACTTGPEIDSGLGRVIARWPDLTPDVRAAILLLIEAGR